MPAPFVFGDTEIAPGSRRTVDLPVSVLSDHTPVTLSAHVIHGRRPGPVMFVSAAVHGDEVIGVEIVRRLLRAGPVSRLAGTLIAVPIVNAFGFLNQSRYLPGPAGSQPLLSRLVPGVARRAPRGSFHVRGGDPLRCRDRPAFGGRGPHQPAADPPDPR